MTPHQSFFAARRLGLGTLGLASCVLATLTPLNSLRGDVVASYQFSGNFNDSSAETNWTTSGITGPGGSFNGELGGSAFSGTDGSAGGSDAIRISGNGTTASDAAGALAAGDYVAFDITPDAGMQITYTDVSWSALARSEAASQHQMSSAIYWSLDDVNFTQLGSDQQTALTPAGAPPQITSIETESPSAGAIGTQTGTVYFRLVMFDGTSLGTKFNVLDNIQVEGTLAVVPEPTSAGVLAPLLGMSLLWSRRRSRRAGAVATKA